MCVAGPRVAAEGGGCEALVAHGGGWGAEWCCGAVVGGRCVRGLGLCREELVGDLLGLGE